MKWILYDMGPLTLVRWPLYRAVKVWHTLQTRIQGEKSLPTQKFKKKMCLVFFIGDNRVLTSPPTLVENSTMAGFSEMKDN